MPHQGTPRRRLDLTEPELMVLRLYSHGLTRKEVAAERWVSDETVKTSIELIRRKLAAKTTTHAVAVALRAGLIK